MKTLILNKKQVNIIKEHFGGKEMTFFAFMSHIKEYLKKLLTDPVNAQPDEFLKMHNLNGEKLLTILKDKGIVVKSTKIDSNGEKDNFIISYKLPRQNFERKIKRLYSELFETNVIDGTILNEEGEGACGGDVIGQGATSADNCNSSAPITPFGPVLRRKIKEEVVMDTACGDFGYDAPPFADKNDPAYDHSNMMKKSFKTKKKKK